MGRLRGQVRRAGHRWRGATGAAVLLPASVAVLQEKVKALESADTSHEHDNEHGHTKMLVNEAEIKLLKVQIEEIKVKASNPLAN